MTGGGTGGHANPAIAIANTIRENQPDAVIEFVGTSRGIENKLVPKEGYKLHHVEVQGFKRRLTPYNIKSAWLAFTSPIKAKKLYPIAILYASLLPSTKLSRRISG